MSNLSKRVLAVSSELCGGERSRVRLADLRAALHSVSRSELDRALFELQCEGALVLYRIDDPRDISADDEQAAMSVAGFHRHILYLC